MTDQTHRDQLAAKAMEASPSGIVVVAENGMITLVNAQTEKLFGYDRAELLGQSVGKLIPVRFREHHHVLRAKFMENPETRPMGAGRDLYGLRKNGSEFPIEIGLNPVRTSEGMYVLAVIVDITERKRIETEREELLHREQAARKEAERVNKLKDEFLATLSHELRTPLTAITGWVSLLQLNVLEEEVRAQAIQTIDRNAKELAKLIEEILDVSRMIVGKLILERRPFNLITVIDHAVKTFQPAVEERGIKLRMSVDSGTREVLGDEKRMSQVIGNLLSNAVKFTPSGGTIAIDLHEPRPGRVAITVADTGAGIDQDFLPHVFERFSQADSSLTRKHGGLGLGLAIAHHLVTLHDGVMTVCSEGKDRGSIFAVELPAIPASRSIRSTQPSVPARRRQSSIMPTLKGISVLIVDDDQDTRELLARLLRKAGANVLVAASVKEALVTLSMRGTDVILSDIQMPEEDGFCLIRKVKAADSGILPAPPAIALTAHAREEDREKMLSAGFVDHIPKPINFEKLVFAIVHHASR